MAFSVIKMNLTAILGNDALAKDMASRLEREWKKEVERAVDKVKFGIHGQRTRDQMDKWIRHLWYKAGAIRNKQCVGPTITKD